jgi:hypothetical protein
MRKYIVGVIFSVIVCCSFMWYEAPTNGGCSIENTTFKDGEKLVFKAFYNWKFIWVPAGEAEFYMKENANDFEVKVYAKTYPGYDDFFRVRDYFYSKIDKRTLYPKTFLRIVEEGDYRKFDSISFDQNFGKAYSFCGKTRSTAVRKTLPYDECMHDLLSVFYFLRNLNVEAYKKGSFVPTKLLIDEEMYNIKVRYEGKEPKKSIKDLGTYKTIKVVPDLLVGNVFKEGDKMNVWVTDDANKIPLLIESPLRIGSAKVILKSHSNLRHPITAKVKSK